MTLLFIQQDFTDHLRNFLGAGDTIPLLGVRNTVMNKICALPLVGGGR